MMICLMAKFCIEASDFVHYLFSQHKIWLLSRMRHLMKCMPCLIKVYAKAYVWSHLKWRGLIFRVLNGDACFVLEHAHATPRKKIGMCVYVCLCVCVCLCVFVYFIILIV